MKERLMCFLSGSKCMTRCGIGPRFSIITVVCGIVTGWLSFQYPTVFKISGIASWFLVGLGCVLVATGATIYIMALRLFNDAYRHGKLATHGLYAFMRHPIYFAWIVLICPGVVLFFQYWLQWNRSDLFEVTVTV
jgi:protein-S-isoprenylcysteine O-methyltransferase Ste14